MMWVVVLALLVVIGYLVAAVVHYVDRVSTAERHRDGWRRLCYQAQQRCSQLDKQADVLVLSLLRQEVEKRRLVGKSTADAAN